jgi:hypothetical protein
VTPHAHIFTDNDPRLFLKQTPGKQPAFNGVRFTFGLDVDPAADVLIVYTRASWSIPTTLPKQRIVFLAGEPEDIHPYSAAFLNQFGTVIAPGNKPLTTHRLEQNYCLPWFAGVNFQNLDTALGYDYFKTMEIPIKDTKISIVTSTKASTEYHRKRLAFIEILKQKIPDRIELYGRGFKPIDDKKDALLSHKYHLALENGGGRFSWSEKLADPLLCWSLPFYVGCSNVHEELPADCIVPLDLNLPEAAINLMMQAQEDDLWSQRHTAIDTARQLLLEKFNTMALIAKLTKTLTIPPATPVKSYLIRAERSLWPEKGARGSFAQMLLRSAWLAVDPKIELRAAKLKARLKNR